MREDDGVKRWMIPVLLAAACETGRGGSNETAAAAGTFGYDTAFLRKHTEVIVLGRGAGRIAVAPAYQGRIMTSTTGGDAGPSFGWLNYPVIERGFLGEAERKGRLEDHIYVLGGEERFWLGPEGGQFALYFAPGAKFEFDAWHTPAVIDTEPFETVAKTDEKACFRRDFELTNYSGTRFKARVERDVRVLGAGDLETCFGVKLSAAAKAVAYETDNRLSNRGTEPWTEQKGLLSIWLLGMYRPSAATTVVVPFRPGPEEVLGPKVNDAYFGKVPPEYLAVKNDVLFLKGDGTHRGKIGLSPARTRRIAGSYEAAQNVLTLVSCNAPEKPGRYVNSMWEIQKNPFGGDVVNAYNDGSPAPGQPPLGPFYELETSSPGAALAPGETIRHVQRTLHVSAPRAELDRIARDKLGAGLDEIVAALPH